MGLIHKNALKAIRIPSSRELARDFGVARSTVQLVLEDLCAKNWLIARHGVGTFSNPSRICLENSMPDIRRPLIGVVYGNGDYFFYNYAGAQCIGSLLRAVGDVGALVHHLQIPAIEEKQSAEEILRMGLDGLIWADGLDRMDQIVPILREKGFPVVTVGRHYLDGVGSVRPSYEEAMKELAARLKKQSRHFLCLEPFFRPDLIYTSFDRYFRGESIEWTRISTQKTEKTTLDMVRTLLDGGFRPDAVFFSASFVLPVSRLLAERGIQTDTVAIENCAEADLPDNGFMCLHDHEKEARSAVHELIRQINAKDDSFRNMDIECFLIQKNSNRKEEK